MRITQRAAKTGTLVLVVAGLGGAVLHSLPSPPTTPSAHRRTGPRHVVDAARRLRRTGGRHDVLRRGLVAAPCLERLGSTGHHRGRRSRAPSAERSGRLRVRGNVAPALATTKPLLPALVERRGYHRSRPSPPTSRPGGRGPALPIGRRRSRQRRGSGRGLLASRPSGARDERARRRAEHCSGRAAHGPRRRRRPARSVRHRDTGGWHRCKHGRSGRPARDTERPAFAVDAHGLRAELPRGHDHGRRDRPRRARRCLPGVLRYRRALYDAQWSRLLHVTASDAAVLDAVRPDQVAVAERVAATIERLAPKAPEGVD